MHFKSLFARQMLLYIGILLIGLSILSGRLLYVFSNYYMESQESVLKYQTQKLAEKYSSGFYTGVINVGDLKKDMEVLTDYTQASVFLVDSNGRVFAVSDQIDPDWVGQTITDDSVKSVLAGNPVTATSKIGGVLADTALSVGYPITVENQVLGGIFLAISLPAIQETINGVYGSWAWASVFAVIIGAALVYVSSRSITKPLVAMNQAAKVIAGGNFEKRLEIQGEDEVAQLAQSFNEMAESLEKNEQVRRQFVANISHDLRSPLTSIQGYLTAILDGTVPEEKRDYYLGVVLDETKRLCHLANDILDLNRAQSIGMHPEMEDFDLHELLRNLLTTLGPRFTDKSITATATFEGQELWVHADREMILRVVQNLLDNAVKFTEADGKIQVETRVRDGKASVVVRDSGRGMTEEEMRHVFERFYKADHSRGEDANGSGLGLAIAREIILAHQQSLAVDSRPGEGSAFTFTLDLAKK